MFALRLCRSISFLGGFICEANYLTNQKRRHDTCTQNQKLDTCKSSLLTTGKKNWSIFKHHSNDCAALSQCLGRPGKATQDYTKICGNEACSDSSRSTVRGCKPLHAKQYSNSSIKVHFPANV